MVDAYRRFWSDNPEFVSLTFARAASYWDAYYRGTVLFDEYPARVALLQIRQLIML